MTRPVTRLAGLSPAARRWAAIPVALVVATVGGCVVFWLVGGMAWLGFAAAASVGGALVGLWYTLGGRTLDSLVEVRERLVERPYVGVAWYASMIRTTIAERGYDRGLRAEMTRLSAARLAERHGVNLYREPAAARNLIGADLWSLVDPQVVPKPGTVPERVPPRAVSELIERLEQL